MSSVNHIHEPAIQPLDADSIIAYAESNQAKRLSDEQKTEIRHLLSTSAAIRGLSLLINKFIQLKHDHDALQGLTPAQVARLNVLITNRKNFLEERKKKEFDTHAYATFITNEKEIVPLTKTLDYWSANTTSLKKLELWEDITTLTISEAEKNGESPDLQKNRLHKLSDIKNEWTTHQVFSGYSSENLNIFYKDYLCVLENSIADDLDAKHNYPVVVNNYIEFLLFQVHELKKQAVNSMLYRLYAAEYFNDMTCDDVLFYTTDKIDRQCNITTNGMGKKPALRKSLTPELIREFIKTIETFCKENKNEKTLLFSLKQLHMEKLQNHFIATPEPAIKTDAAIQQQIDTLLENIFSHDEFDPGTMQSLFQHHSDPLFCNTDILERIEKSLFINKTGLDFNALCAVANLLLYLASDDVKISLLNTYRRQLNENPYWLALVNHLGDKSILASIEYTINIDNTIPHQPEFFSLLEFAKHLSKLKHSVNEMMKLSILREAHISPVVTEKINVQEILHSTSVSDKQLLELWSACANKLTKDYLRSGMKLSYANFLVKILDKTAEEIFIRCAENHSLIQQFTARLQQIPAIVTTIRTVFNDTDNDISLWANRPTSGLLLQTVFTMVKKACVLELTQHTEQYAQKKLSHEKFIAFKRTSNDATYTNIATLKTQLGIKDDVSATMMYYTMKIYICLLAVGENKANLNAFPALVESLLENVSIDDQFSVNNNYTIFLRELLALSAKSLSILNNNLYQENESEQKVFSTDSKPMYLTSK